MHYYLYEIKNLINGKIYVGVHKTKSLDDGYMGSGKVISNAIRKYGIESFTKTILETFDTAEQMFAREAEVVNEAFLARDDVYNLRRGGTGGFDYINATLSEAERVEKNQRARATTTAVLEEKYGPNFKSILSRRASLSRTAESFSKRRATRLQRNVVSDSKHMNTAASIAKRTATFAKTGHQQGEKNSQFGKMWITDGTSSRTISKGDEIPAGWRKGRVISRSN